MVAVNSNLNFRSVDKKVIKRIEIETGTAVRFAAGILRFKDFSFILCTLYLRCSVGMNEENEIRMKQLSMLQALVGLPFMMPGDYNMSSEVLWKSCWPQHLRATVVDSQDCLSTLRYTSGRLIDFVLISDSMVAVLKEVVLYPEFPSTPHYSLAIKLHRSPRLVTEPMVAIPRPLPFEDFKDRWRLMDEKSRSDLINQGHQKARSMLDKQLIKSWIRILGFPLKAVLEDP